jgi:hypothetical protein
LREDVSLASPKVSDRDSSIASDFMSAIEESACLWSGLIEGLHVRHVWKLRFAGYCCLGVAISQKERLNWITAWRTWSGSLQRREWPCGGTRISQVSASRCGVGWQVSKKNAGTKEHGRENKVNSFQNWSCTSLQHELFPFIVGIFVGNNR